MTTPPQMPQQAPPNMAPPNMASPQQAPTSMPPPQQAPAGPAGAGPVPAQPAGAGVGAYASPIPVRRTHLGHAIASEWTKIRTVRSTVWTLVTMFVLTVGIGLLVAIGLDTDDNLETPLLSGGFFGLMLGQLCIITLGVLVVSSEYSTGMMRTTLTACPQRGRVLLAKAMVFFLLAFTMTLAACGLTGLILSSILANKPVDQFADWELMEESVDEQTGEVIATADHWLGATVGAALYVSLLGLLGLALGALLRHSAGAITTMVGVVLLPLIMALFMVGESLQTLREKLIEYSPLNGLAALHGIPMQQDGSTGWPLLGVLAVISVGMLIVAFAKISARDA